MSQTSTPKLPPSNSRQQLRQQIRRFRRSLSPQQQRYAANQLCLQLSKQHRLKSAKAIAAYLPNDGEISPEPLMQWAHSLGKTLYLPVLHPFKKGHLWFVEYRPDSKMKTNRYGIVEPDHRYNKIASIRALDVVLLPLVAFDRQGGRLGMGGGYYDRTFACRQKSLPFEKPRLIGLAHELQEVKQLSIANWDIPLMAISTDKEVIHC